MLTSDIIWLQEQGKRYELSARLYNKVEYIWLTSSDELTLQSTLFRFTYMIYSPKDEQLAAGDKPDGNSEDAFVVLWGAFLQPRRVG